MRFKTEYLTNLDKLINLAEKQNSLLTRLIEKVTILNNNVVTDGKEFTAWLGEDDLQEFAKIEKDNPQEAALFRKMLMLFLKK